MMLKDLQNTLQIQILPQKIAGLVNLMMNQNKNV